MDLNNISNDFEYFTWLYLETHNKIQDLLDVIKEKNDKKQVDENNSKKS